MTAELVELRRGEDRSVPPAFSSLRGAVYHADCLDLFSSLRDACIDTIFADPPFNIRKDYGRGKDKDNIGHQDYLDWCFNWIDESIRVLKPGGSLFVYNLPRWAYHRCMQISTNQGDVVLDPFGGGGSTFEAAEKLGRYWLGAEIVDCELIRDRLARNVPELKLGTPEVLSSLLRHPNATLSIDLNTCPTSSKRSGTTAQNSASSGLASLRSSMKEKGDHGV